MDLDKSSAVMNMYGHLATRSIARMTKLEKHGSIEFMSTNIKVFCSVITFNWNTQYLGKRILGQRTKSGFGDLVVET